MVRTGFRYGDDAPMAIIELVDRDFQARRVDIKKKNEPQKKELKDKKETKETKEVKSKK